MEQWKPLNAPFEGYEVSDEGNIKSPKGKVLSKQINPRTKQVTVEMNDSELGKRRRVQVKELIAMTFINGYTPQHSVRILKDSDKPVLTNIEVYDPTFESEDKSLPNRDVLAEMIKNRRTLESIAKEFNTTREILRRVVGRYKIREGLTIESPVKGAGRLNTRAGYFTESPELVYKIFNLLGSHTFREIARTLGVEDYEIRNILRRLNFPHTYSDLLNQYQEHFNAGTLTEYMRGDFNRTTIPLEPGEIKKKIEGRDGYYITNFGRVISYKVFAREEVIGRHVKGSNVHVTLCSESVSTKVSVAKLVLEAFTDKEYNPTTLTYADGDSQNCHVDNLIQL